MNENEVIANRAIEMKTKWAQKKPVHPNDHVNKSQSINDNFATFIIYLWPNQKQSFTFIIWKKNYLMDKEFKNIVKIGRTHLLVY